MQTFIDLAANEEYHFDDSVIVADFTPDGITLTATPSARPSAQYDFIDEAWSLVRIDDLRDKIWDDIKARRSEIMLGDVLFNGDAFQSRDMDALNAQKVIQASAAALTWPIMVDTSDNQRISASKADMIAIADLIVKLHYDTNEHAQSLRADIIAADDPSTIDINSGWPTVPYTGA